MVARKISTIILLLILIVACGGAEDDASPSVKILAPTDGYSLTLGETLHLESRAKDDGGVDRVEWRADTGSISTIEVPEGEKSFRTQQSWKPEVPGSYTVAVTAFDDKGQASEPATISVNVVSAQGSPAAPQSASGTAPVPTAVSSALPDLDIIDVQGNLDLAVDEPLALQVTVHNQGPGASDRPALVRLTIGDGTATESHVPPLPPGGHVLVAVSLSHGFSQEAELTIVIAVDPDGEIDETFDDNNATSVRVRVTPP